MQCCHSSVTAKYEQYTRQVDSSIVVLTLVAHTHTPRPHPSHLPHQVAVEGVVGPGEVAADESNGDSHEVQAEPALVDHLRLTVEHVVPSRAEQAHLQCVCVLCVCVCVVCVCVSRTEKKQERN